MGGNSERRRPRRYSDDATLEFRFGTGRYRLSDVERIHGILQEHGEVEIGDGTYEYDSIAELWSYGPPRTFHLVVTVGGWRVLAWQRTRAGVSMETARLTTEREVAHHQIVGIMRRLGRRRAAWLLPAWVAACAGVATLAAAITSDASTATQIAVFAILILAAMTTAGMGWASFPNDDRKSRQLLRTNLDNLQRNIFVIAVSLVFGFLLGVWTQR